jgi:hypothetical protein
MHRFLEDELDLHRPEGREQDLHSPRFGNTQALKTQLLQEIVELESQLERALSANPVDLSQIQTCTDMLQSRKQFFNELERRG